MAEEEKDSAERTIQDSADASKLSIIKNKFTSFLKEKLNIKPKETNQEKAAEEGDGETNPNGSSGEGSGGSSGNNGSSSNSTSSSATSSGLSKAASDRARIAKIAAKYANFATEVAYAGLAFASHVVGRNIRKSSKIADFEKQEEEKKGESAASAASAATTTPSKSTNPKINAALEKLSKNELYNVLLHGEVLINAGATIEKSPTITDLPNTNKPAAGESGNAGGNQSHQS
jgi:hypothetical protein